MKSFSRAGQLALRRASRTPLRAQLPINGVIARASVASTIKGNTFNAVRNFHSSMNLRGIMPESENPPPKESQDSETPTTATDITTSEFHERADEYFDELLSRLEEKQDESPEYDVEYSASVL